MPLAPGLRAYPAEASGHLYSCKGSLRAQSRSAKSRARSRLHSADQPVNAAAKPVRSSSARTCRRGRPSDRCESLYGVARNLATD